MRWHGLLPALPASPSHGETWQGVPRIRDGNTIVIGGKRLRLMSMDAFEASQTCRRDNQDYGCGQVATEALAAIVNGRSVTCDGRIRDRSGLVLVKCHIDSEDLGAAVVRSGWAVAEWHKDYRHDEAFSRSHHMGVWGGLFVRPREWRKWERVGC